MVKKKRLSYRVVARYSLQNQKRKRIVSMKEDVTPDVAPVVIENILLLQGEELLLQDNFNLLLN